MNNPPIKNPPSHWKKYKFYYLIGASFLLLLTFILLINSSSNQEIKKVNRRLTRMEMASNFNESPGWNYFDNLDLPQKNEYSSNFTTPNPKKQDANWISETIPSADIQKQVRRWINAFKYLPDYRAKYGPEINRHVLLSGPTGSGKSYLADQFCEHESCVWSKVHFETEIWKGSSLKKQKAALAEAKVYAAAEIEKAKKEKRPPRPAVLVIEEIDSVGIKEMSGLGSSSGRDEVNGLLKLFDDVQKENLNIVLIATTNYPDSLDDALVRPGRFGRRIEVPYPTDEEIEKLVRYVEKTMKGKYGYKTATNRSDWGDEKKDEKKVVSWPANFWDQAAQITKEVKKKYSKHKMPIKGFDGKVKEEEIDTEVGFAFPDISQIIENCLADKRKENQLEIVPEINDYRQFFDKLLAQKKKDWLTKIRRRGSIHVDKLPPHQPTPDPTKDPEKDR